MTAHRALWFGKTFIYFFCHHQKEALQGMDATELPLSLDDFIPPHLQRNQKRGASQSYDARLDSSDQGDLLYKATMVLTDDCQDSPSPRIERRWIRYEGIGPTDDDGMPFASRSSVDKPREWYKNMYKILHQMSDSEESDGDSNWPKSEDHHKEAFTQSNNSKFRTDESNGQPEPEDRFNRRAPETSHLHITVNSKISESPNMAITTLQAKTSPDSSKLRATTLPHSSSRQASQTSPNYSSKVSQFINNSNTKHSSEIFNTQQSHRAFSRTSDEQKTSEPGLGNFFPGRSSNTSQNNKETTSLQSLKQKSKYPTSSSSTSGTPVLSPTSKEPRRSTSRVLDQLETDLRNFTEELNKELDTRKQPEATLEQCEEVILRRYSHRAGGSPEPKANKSSRRTTEEPQDLSPISKAVVKFDFVAESEKEISLQRGTTVNILKKIDEHWLLGEQDGRRGIFPQSYVRVLTPGEPEPLDTPQLSGIALYDFKADSERELPLRKGQRVLINRRVGGNWFEGRVEGSRRLGLFPASYVQVKDAQARKADTLPKRAADTNSVEKVSSVLTLKERPCTVKAPAFSRLQELRGTLYRVLFNYSPKNSDELQLNAGDMVTVTQHCEDGWYVGVCWRTEKFGTFPGNFVTPYEAT
ncbi:vinexin isoform X4 [Ranitomeya imitator]|uniref:vinexin isoform X4 n=2 Tax=Ranitomeya imitator TaxID=111125 RepID=UPI0037E75B01